MGSDIVVSGSLETRYSLLTLRLPDAAAIAATGGGGEPAAVTLLTGEVAELVESQLVTVTATVTDGISVLSDGFSTAVDDGSGSLRVIVSTISAINADTLSRGSLVQLTGVVGQRDTSGTGTAGYRLHLRTSADILSIAPPLPSPSASPAPEPTTTATVEPSAPPTATPTPSSAPTVTPAPTPAVLSIAAARGLAPGETATIQGTVTVEPGRLPDDSLIAVQDATGGMCLQVPPGGPLLTRGDVVLVTGSLAAPYGNLELRPADAADLVVVGHTSLPSAVALTAAQVGESSEGLLASVTGTLTQIDSTSTSLTLFVDDGTGEVRVFITAALGIVRADFTLGSQLAVTGVVADRLGLYRIWPRDRADIVASVPPGPSPSPTPSPTQPPVPTPTPAPTATPPPAPEVMAIAGALRHIGETVAISGTVTSPAGLLDADSRRVTVEDSSGAVLVRLPELTSVRVGDRLLIVGEMGTYYGAPQLAATDAPVPLAGGKAITPTAAKSAPLPSKLEWRLVTVSGGITAVSRDGDAWHAELSLSGGSVRIDGLARSGIPSTVLDVGRTATVVGIVKRAYPTATDQRLAIIPRSGADIALGGPAPKGNPSAGRPDANPASGVVGEDVRPGDQQSVGAPVRQPAAISLADLANHESELVFVGGRLDAIEGERLLVNDGTSLAAICLPRASNLGSLTIGLLVNAWGKVARTEQGGLEIVVDSTDDVRVLEAVIRLAEPSSLGLDAGLQPNLTAAAARLETPAPGNAVVVFVIAGMLALAAAVGVAGVVIARRPDLLRSAVSAVAGLRARK